MIATPPVSPSARHMAHWGELWGEFLAAQIALSFLSGCRNPLSIRDPPYEVQIRWPLLRVRRDPDGSEFPISMKMVGAGMDPCAKKSQSEHPQDSEMAV